MNYDNCTYPYNYGDDEPDVWCDEGMEYEPVCTPAYFRGGNWATQRGCCHPPRTTTWSRSSYCGNGNLDFERDDCAGSMDVG